MAATPVWAANDDPPCVEKHGAEETATIEFSKTNVGLILSYQWGEGIVVMKEGHNFEFKLKGLKLLDNGASVTDFVGVVYNLKDRKDFPGTYSGAKFGATIVKAGAGQLLMENNNGKCIFIRAEAKNTSGLNLSPPGPGGITIELTE